MAQAPADGKRGGQPPFAGPIPENMPSALRDLSQWVAWNTAPRAGRPKPPKVPIDPHTGRAADPTDPHTWGTLDDALDLSHRLQLAGVGFVFTESDPFAGVDLDGCLDPRTGQLDPWAEEIVAGLRTYTEISPSCTGVKLVARAKLPGRRCRKGKVELYDRGRYFALTGRPLGGAPADVRPAQDALDALYRELFDRGPTPSAVAQPPLVNLLPDDAELIRRACAARNGPKFERLWRGDWSGYATHSEADLALARLLAFWTGPDPVRTDALFRRSGLMRSKWDERRGSETYGQRTARRALETCRAFYGAADLGRLSPPAPTQAQKTQNRVSNECATSQAPSTDSPGGDLGRLVAHVRRLRRLHGRPVGLSARQAGELLDTPYRTAARRLKEAVKAGLLVVALEGTYASGLASEYDLPEFVPAPEPTPAAPPPAKPSANPTGPPPYTRTPGGLLAVWWWSSRQGRWCHFGDCIDRAAADALAGRHMPRRPGRWSVGAEQKHYVRGHGLWVDQRCT
jgi:hypothetical protein